MKLWEKIYKIVPRYALIPLLWEFIWNTMVYSGTRMIAGNWYHHNIESSLDARISLVPWTVSIYLVCFLFWAINYVIAVRQGEDAAMRFLSADFISKCVCLICFLVLPTTNVRPEVIGSGLWETLLKIVYHVDAADNLFPSIHCLVSWFCFIGVRGKKNIPLLYQGFNCVFALAVFVSTLTTKQHVLVDVIAGMLLAESSYYLAEKTGFALRYRRFFERINRILPD